MDGEDGKKIFKYEFQEEYVEENTDRKKTNLQRRVQSSFRTPLATEKTYAVKYKDP
jgi:hypothetical protein